MYTETHVVFIDEALPDLEILAKASSFAKIVFLHHDAPLLVQMAQALTPMQDVAHIHLFTHGSSGEILLGTNGVSLETLPLYGKELLAITQAMKSEGEIFLYGCEVALDERGASFVALLSQITELKVAAATHKIGCRELGGSWELDVMSEAMRTKALHVGEWRGVLAAPGNGVYTFANAVDNTDGTYTTADGFFLISAVNGEVADASDDLVYADGDGASLSVSGPTSSPASPTSYLEVKPTTTGSFTLNSAVIGETYTNITTDNDYTNIYVVGYANGVEMARTATYSSVNTLEPTYTFSQDYFSPFANKMIDTVRVYFDTPTGDMADRLTLINMNISGASTVAAPVVPLVNFNYTVGGDFFTINSVNGSAPEASMGNTTDVPNANILFGAGIDDGAFTAVYQIGGSSGISSFNSQTDGKLEYLAINSHDAAVSLRQFKVYNDSANDITLTITGHAEDGVYDSNLVANPAMQTTTAVAVHGQWTTVNLPADFGEYHGVRIDSGSGTGTVPLYFNGFVIETTPPSPAAIDLNGANGDGNDFAVTMSASSVALADTDATVANANMVYIEISADQIKAGDRLIFENGDNDITVALDGTTSSDAPILLGDAGMVMFIDPTTANSNSMGNNAVVAVAGDLATLLQSSMKFSGSVAGDRVFTFLDGNTMASLATSTVSVEASSSNIVLDLDQVGDGNADTNNSVGTFQWYNDSNFADNGTVLGDSAPAEYQKLTISFDMSGWDSQAYPYIGTYDQTEDWVSNIRLTRSSGYSTEFDYQSYGGETQIKVTMTWGNGGERLLTVENADSGQNISKTDLNKFLQHLYFYESDSWSSETRVFSLQATAADGTETDTSTFSVSLAPDTTPPELYTDEGYPWDGQTDFNPASGDPLYLSFSEDVIPVEGKYIHIWNADGTLLEQFDVADADVVEVDGSDVNFTPTQEMPFGSSYYITVDAGAFTDASLNGTAALTDPTALNFTVKNAPLGTWTAETTAIEETDPDNGPAANANLEYAIDGTPYVLYEKYDGTDNKLTLEKQNSNGSWSVVGTSNFAGAYDASYGFVLKDGTTPYVFTTSMDTTDYYIKQQVFTLVGDAWEQVGTDLRSNRVNTKVTIEQVGTKMVAASFYAEGDGRTANYYIGAKTLDLTNPTADWVETTSSILTGSGSDHRYDWNFSLTKVDGAPVLVWSTNAEWNGEPTAQSCNIYTMIDGAWSLIDTSTTTNNLTNVGLIYGAEGFGNKLYVLYSEANSNLANIAVWDKDANTWTDLPFDEHINSQGSNDLSLDSNGVPYVALGFGGGGYKTLKWDTTTSSWLNLDDTTENSDTYSGSTVDLEIDAQSAPHLVATVDECSGADDAGSLKYLDFIVTGSGTGTVSSVILNVANPFTPNDVNDTTAITIAAPNGIDISSVANSTVTGLPKNVKMPLGQFGFTLSGLEDGATVQMSMTADTDFKQFSYFKKSLVTNKWVNIMEGVTINDDGTATVKFSLKDGGEFDADRTANGVIVDPGGVGENALLPLVAENTTEVGNISLLDNTLATGTLSYSITSGADAAKFTIDASTGLLSFTRAPDYEIPTDTGDTEENNTYAVQVTLTGSTSGSEVQNLIVTVLNVAEVGDNANAAPVIVGLRAEAQAVTVGTAAVLDDIRVVDANNNNMTLTLTATNGTIGGLNDADANTAGIQLTGTATTINTALATATFTATAAGGASVNLSVVDDPSNGTAITTTGVYAITAVAPSSDGGGYTPPTTTVDGATVQTGTTTETRTTTDTNGNTVTTTVSTETITIAPVSGNRTDSTGTATTADIPLFWGESTRTEWATTASIPTGIGLTTAGSRAPSTTQTSSSALADLLYYIDTTTPTTDPGKTGMLGGGSSFLDALANIETLVVNKVTLTTSTTSAPSLPITITGTANTIVTTHGAQAPQEALVIDASALPVGTVLNLENVEFAVIVGEGITVRGGEGANIFFSGAGSQNILLGADDDELHAGDGNDIVGSAGGNDKIFGESGNDTIFGGEGNDLLHGGSGTDVATYTGNRAEYIITRDEGYTYVALSSKPTEVDTLINAENIKFADATYTVGVTTNQEQVATLYTQILDRQAEMGGYQYWAHVGEQGNLLGAMAINFIKSQEYQNVSGKVWNSLDTAGKVEVLYEAILSRASEAEGKTFWMVAIAHGATFEQIAEGFVDSLELSGIYQTQTDWNFTL